MSQQLYMTQPLTPLIARDITKNNQRLLLTRWVAGGLVIMLTAFCVRVLRLELTEGALYILGVLILVYNYGLVRRTQQLDDSDLATYLLSIRRLVIVQIILDWLSVAVFIHLTGGISSPGIIFFFIHVLLVTILLPGQSPYIYVALAVTVVLGLALLETHYILPHHNVIPQFDCSLCFNAYYILSQVIFLGIGLLATVFVTSAIINRLREREHQISILLQNMRQVSSSLELPNVLDQLARGVAEALGVPGSSIRLLNPDGETLRLAASYGLSQRYLAKGLVELSQSDLDREALGGEVVIIDHAWMDTRVQYPREIAAEGIESMLVVPIIGRQPLGVLRVYSNLPKHFKHKDAEIVQTIAFQSASAIENAMGYDALQQAEKERTQFILHVTHELRAPVNGAKSLLRVLSDNLLGELPPPQMDIVKRLERRMEGLLGLIRDLLELADSKSIVHHTDVEPLDIVPLMTNLIDQYRIQAKQHHLELRLHLPEIQKIYALATEAGLSGVLENIVSNAIKYTPEGGLVSVSVKTGEAETIIKVKDSGIGIPEEEIARLGEEFYRASNARHSDIEGTGLGLAIVKHVVGQLGGEFSIASKQGQGTTVTITLRSQPIPDLEQAR